MPDKYIPDGYHTVTPYLTLDDAAFEIQYLQRAFNAQIRYEMKDDKGSVRHAEVQIGDSVLMLGHARDEWKSRPMTFYLYVPDPTPSIKAQFRLAASHCGSQPTSSMATAAVE